VRKPRRPDVVPDKSIVDEPVIKINRALLNREALAVSRGPAMKAFLSQVERSMSNSWRFPWRYPLGTVGFLDTEFFRDRVEGTLPTEVRGRLLSSMAGLPAKLVSSLGDHATVADALKLDLSQLARRSGLSIEGAVRLRERILGIARREPGGGQ
jgi:hypothetical protein